MHLDLNSCFATIEQQANPHLRGKPVAVAAYTTPSGCIIAPSIEAKEHGVKVGMRVKDGKMFSPGLIVLPPDPWKYRSVHLSLRNVMEDYTSNVYPKSIDEFVLNLEGYPSGPDGPSPNPEVLRTGGMGRRPAKSSITKNMWRTASEIKQRIKSEIGEWLTVSVGIGPNRFLAKTASSLRKPDGLDEINKANYLKIYKGLELIDLCGIKMRNAARLNSMGIYTVLDFYNAPIWKLKAAFSSILGYYWYARLHGFEIDDVEFGRRSYENSYALPKPLTTPEKLAPILAKLVTKMGSRLRRAGYKARGVHLAVSYRDGSFWHKGITFPKVFFDSRNIYKEAFKMLSFSPYRKPVRSLAVSCFNLLKSEACQLELFDDIERRFNLVKAIDKVNERWGDFVITPARMLAASKVVPDRVAFGNAKELEEFTIKA